MSRKMIVRVILFMLAVVLIIPAAIQAASPRVGVVLLHGKTGKPEKLWGLASALEAQGFLVFTPAMPWSHNRYLDASYETALDEIAAAINQLKQQGATKIVVAGHSMGANAALAYAANRGGVAGVIMLAPGHFPDLPQFQEIVKGGVAKAREMVQSGHGTQNAEFPRHTTRGSILLLTRKPKSTSAISIPAAWGPWGATPPGSMPRSLCW